MFCIYKHKTFAGVKLFYRHEIFIQTGNIFDTNLMLDLRGPIEKLCLVQSDCEVYPTNHSNDALLSPRGVLRAGFAESKLYLYVYKVL